MAHVDSHGDARSCPRAFNTLVGTTAKLVCYPVSQLPAVPCGNLEGVVSNQLLSNHQTTSINVWGGGQREGGGNGAIY